MQRGNARPIGRDWVVGGLRQPQPAVDTRTDQTSQVSPTAATAIDFAGIPSAPRMRLISFRPLWKDSLRGSTLVELPIGLRIDDVSIHVSHVRVWAGLPTKPMIDREAHHKRDANGQRAYLAMLQWRDRSILDKFCKCVLELVRKVHPEAVATMP